MFPPRFGFVLALLLVPAVRSSTVPLDCLAAFDKRAKTTISDGSSFMTGKFPSGLKWQSSGLLYNGGCTSGKQLITDCYELGLSSDPSQNLIPSSTTPRQRIEFLNNAAADGTKWKYTWKSYYPGYITGSNNFFHIMQIFSNADNNPVYFLDVLKNQIIFKDAKANAIVASIPLANFLERPLKHSLIVTYGPKGSINYQVTDGKTGANVIGWSKSNAAVGSGGTYLKFGAYRQTFNGEQSVKAWYGDYTEQQL